MLTDQQKFNVKAWWIDMIYPTTSHTIACKLGLTHEYVQEYIKELNKQQ